MQLARWMLFAMTFAVSSICLCQKVTGSKLAQPEATARARDPHSTAADLAVPLCPAKFDDNLETNGIATSDDKKVIPPKLVHSVLADFPQEIGQVRCRKRQKDGLGFESKSEVSIVVDERGNPKSFCLKKTSGYGLDANAAKAIQQYTFDPATEDGKPVPYRLSVEIDFTRSCY